MQDEFTYLKKYKEQNPNELTQEQFEKIEAELLHPKDGTISDERLDFKLWCQGLLSRQEAFAEYISQEFLQKTGNSEKIEKLEKPSRILEVGGGRRGRLSRLLAEKGYEMTCMDPELEMEKEKDGIVWVKKVFDYRTVSLKGYDLVVAQEPCEAAEHIIRACLEQKVPFVIALCGTPHRLISGEMPEDVWEWYEYLQDIDREYMKLEITKLYQLVSVAVISWDF